MRKNLILDTDSYKFSHYLQYPPGITNVNSYIESRGDSWNDVVFFGLQAWILENLTNRIKMHDIDEAEEIAKLHGFEHFNRAGWEYILNKHGGYLPLYIEAVKEGTPVPVSNVLVQVRNTDPNNCNWLTSYIETSLLRGVWYPCTVATRSREIKSIINDYLLSTADSTAGLPFKLHDFGFRGVSSFESGSIGGLAHLVNFMGTDTVGALLAGRKYYNEKMAGYSIPAAEHSTIVSWGQDRESDAYRNMLDTFGGPGKLVAVVSDSYNIYDAVRHIWGEELKEKVMNFGGTLVVRPDSGEPKKVVVEVLNILGEKFGYSLNSKNFKVLPTCIRVIQGDGINQHSIREILYNMYLNGWSADNVAFGMGGQLLQALDRDTYRFAMKASAISYDGGNSWKPVWKQPIDDLMKKSKKGILHLVKKDEEDSNFETLADDDFAIQKLPNILEPVYYNGDIKRIQTLAEVRELAKL